MKRNEKKNPEIMNIKQVKDNELIRTPIKLVKKKILKTKRHANSRRQKVLKR
jgi:hypothetical protein